MHRSKSRWCEVSEAQLVARLQISDMSSSSFQRTLAPPHCGLCNWVSKGLQTWCGRSTQKRWIFLVIRQKYTNKILCCLVLGQQGHQDVTVIDFLPTKINIVPIYFKLEFHPKYAFVRNDRKFKSTQPSWYRSYAWLLDPFACRVIPCALFWALSQ